MTTNGTRTKKSELLYGAHLAIKRLEWIDRHTSPRLPRDASRLVREIDDLEAWLERLLRVFSPPPEPH